MELGEKLRAARIAAGMSQRQLCGNEITRNMLSQIENGSASPSMNTLRYLASRLEKPISFFLEEDALISTNSAVMEAARNAYDAGRYGEAAQALEQYRGADLVFDRERDMIECLLRLALARSAWEQGRDILARQLLEELPKTAYLWESLNHCRLLILSELPGEDPVEIVKQLPGIDTELLLRGKAAMAAGEYDRGVHLLEAMEDHLDPARDLLLGQLYIQKGEYRTAVDYLSKAEDAYPMEAAGNLEICYRELGDYQMAYVYACKQR